MKAIKIMKALYPIVVSILEDVQKAKSEKSDGGKAITKGEKQEIIFNHILELIPAIEKMID